MHPRPSRRGFLVGGVATVASLSGCAGLQSLGNSCESGYSLEARELTDAELAEAVTTEPRGRYEEAATQLIDTAAREGEATHTSYHGPPLRAGIYVEHEGTYYRTEREVTETRTLTAHEIRFEYDEEEIPPGDATVVAFSDLPEADKTAFEGAYPSEKLGDDKPLGFSFGYTHVYPDDADSRFIAEETLWVRYEGEPYRVTVKGTEQVEEQTYRYTLEEVAEDRASFVAFLRERYVVALDDLSDAERDVFEQAMGESVTECAPLPEGFQGLVDRFESLPEERRLRYGTYLASYEGGTYAVELSQFVA